MKKAVFILWILGSLATSFSQNTEVSNTVTALKSEILQSRGSVKLKLLDSLSQTVLYQTEHNYDSIVKATIDHAIELDSFDLAAKHTASRIFYLANRAGKPEEARQVFDDFLAKELKVSNPAINASLFMNGGDSYFYSGEIEQSIAIYKKSGEYAYMAKDSTVLSKSKIYGSEALIGMGQYAEAALLLDEAEEISRIILDTSSIMVAQHMRANLYGSIGFVEEANAVRDDLIRLAEKKEHYHLIQSAYYNKAVDDDATGDYESMINNLKKAQHYVEKIDIPYERNKILIALFRAYSRTDSIAKAKSILDEIHKLPNYSDIATDDFNYIAALAKYEYALGNTEKAIALQESLMEHSTAINVVNSLSIHSFLAEAYEGIDLAKSYDHYKKYTSLNDSVNNVKKTKALTYYQTLYETEKRDFKIAQQESEITVLDHQTEIQKQWMLFGGLGLILGFSIIYLIRSRNFSRKEKENQELFSQELIKSQENQRTRVARDLHDSVGQKLMLLTKKVALLKNKDVDDLVKDTLNELRGISRGLYPASFEKLGVTASIASMIDEVDANTNLFFTTDIDNIDDAFLKEDALHLYRIIQEALNNTLKHAGAKSVSVSISRKENTIETTVADNGIGFEFTKNHDVHTGLGTKTLFERAKIIKSKLSIDSTKNKGTTLLLITPIR